MRRIAVILLFGLLNFSCVAVDAQEKTGELTSVTSAQRTQQLWDEWFQEASRKGPVFNDPTQVFNFESFKLFAHQGFSAITLVVDKVRQKEDLGSFFDSEFGYDDLMRYISKTNFRFQRVPTPENAKLTVYKPEEFPTMEVYRRPGQVRELWLKWWAEKDTKTPIWFRGRYQMWQTALKAKDKTKADALYRRTIDLGIFALPQWMDKLTSDPTHSKEIIAAVSELTTQEVAPDAKPAQVKAWWKQNKDKWTKVS